MQVPVSNLKKKYLPCVKYYLWNPATCSCKTGKYLASIIDNSIITCREIIYTTKNVPTKSVLEKSISVNLYILLSLLVVTIAIMSIIYSVALQLNEVLYQKYITNMESKDELMDINIKSHKCYHFDGN